MEAKVKELVSNYAEYEKAIKRLKNAQDEIRRELIELAPHKRGDVIKWMETGRKKNMGTWWEPHYKDVPDAERRGVVRRVRPMLWVNDERPIENALSYDYEFVVINKATGEPGVNQVHPSSKYEWTGEHIDMDK